MRITIIEDDEAIGFSLRLALEDEGHEVTIYSDPRKVPFDALETDLILLDYYMPNLDGVQVAQLLRGNARLQSTRIIMMSASPQLLPVAESLHLEHLAKPFDLDTLYRRIGEGK